MQVLRRLGYHGLHGGSAAVAIGDGEVHGCAGRAILGDHQEAGVPVLDRQVVGRQEACGERLHTDGARARECEQLVLRPNTFPLDRATGQPDRGSAGHRLALQRHFVHCDLAQAIGHGYGVCARREFGDTRHRAPCAPLVGVGSNAAIGFGAKAAGGIDAIRLGVNGDGNRDRMDGKEAGSEDERGERSHQYVIV